MIRDFCHSLDCVEEKFIKIGEKRYCSLEEITTDPNVLDYYIGCWRKMQDKKIKYINDSVDLIKFR